MYWKGRKGKDRHMLSYFSILFLLYINTHLSFKNKSFSNLSFVSHIFLSWTSTILFLIFCTCVSINVWKISIYIIYEYIYWPNSLNKFGMKWSSWIWNNACETLRKQTWKALSSELDKSCPIHLAQRFLSIYDCSAHSLFSYRAVWTLCLYFSEYSNIIHCKNSLKGSKYNLSKIGLWNFKSNAKF